MLKIDQLKWKCTSKNQAIVHKNDEKKDELKSLSMHSNNAYKTINKLAFYPRYITEKMTMH